MIHSFTRIHVVSKLYTLVKEGKISMQELDSRRGKGLFSEGYGTILKFRQERPAALKLRQRSLHGPRDPIAMYLAAKPPWQCPSRPLYINVICKQTYIELPSRVLTFQYVYVRTNSCSHTLIYNELDIIL